MAQGGHPTWMCISARTVIFFILTAAAASAAPGQFVARYLPIGSFGSAISVAADASGNLFVVATVQEPSGQQQIRAIKTDPQGNEVASFDFGSGSDLPAGAAVDAQGNLVIVGTTYAQSFPLVSPATDIINYQAGFVVKLDSQLTRILFSTVLGGSQGASAANAVALDAAGNIYLTGSTTSADFPVTPGAFQTTGPMNNGVITPSYAFVTEISPDGASTVYSTYFGSASTNCNGGSTCIGAAGNTSANAIALDSTGAVVIGGYTTANQLPVTPGTLGQQCNCGYRPFVQSGFLAKFAPLGKQLDWATYIPLAQPSPESASGYLSITFLAMDAQGDVIFGGGAPTGLFVTKGALQTSYPTANLAGDYGAPFLAKVNASASSYLFSTYFGEGVFGSIGLALALDSQGDIWLTGGSAPSALPIPSSTPLLGNAFVAELSADGASVINAITAPAGAAGQAIVITPNGSPTALGSAGSLLLDLPGQPASLVGVANSAGVQVSSDVAPYELVSFFGVGLGPAAALGERSSHQFARRRAGAVQQCRRPATIRGTKSNQRDRSLDRVWRKYRSGPNCYAQRIVDRSHAFGSPFRA
jgi:hypothetical protein